MKQFVYFLILYCTNVAFTYAQDDILKRKVSVDFKDGRLEDLLFKIAEEASFNLSYNAALIPNDSLLSYAGYQQMVEQVFKVILPIGLETKNTGQHLVIVKKAKQTTEQKKEKYLVQGVVKGPGNQSGLPQVLVFDMVGLVSTITDDQGKFSMSLSQQYDMLALSFSKTGYSNEVVLLPPQNHQLSQELLVFDESFQSKRADNSPTPPAPIESVGFVRQVVKGELTTRSDNFRGNISRSAQLSLWPGISTNLLMGSAVQNNLSINIFGGYSKGLKGIELGGLFNINREQVSGFQAAGLANLTGGDVQAVQLAGLANHTKGNQSGVQVGGVYNTIMGQFEGLQLSGVSNVIGKDLQGWQIAGVNNVVIGTMQGAQLSGVLNTTRGEVKLMQLTGVANKADEVSGLQGSGVLNFTRKGMTGVQMAGVANWARYTAGAQISGVINVALDSAAGVQLGVINFTKNLKSSQIGIFNYADSASGIPFGLVSIVRKGGYIAPELSANELTYGNLALKMGVRKLYNTFSVGVGQYENNPMVAVGYGLGSQPKLGAKTFLIAELSSHWMRVQGEPIEHVNILQRFMLGVGFGKDKGIKISAGPTLNALMTIDTDKIRAFENSIAPYSMREFTVGENIVQLWIGGRVAVHL